MCLWDVWRLVCAGRRDGASGVYDSPVLQGTMVENTQMNDEELADKLTSIINRSIIVQHLLASDVPLDVFMAKVTLLEDIAEDAQAIALGCCVRG